VAALPPTRGSGFEALDEFEELSYEDLRSAPLHSAPLHSAPTEEPLHDAAFEAELSGEDFQTSPMHAAPAPPDAPVDFAAPDEEIVELGQDVIVGEEREAHRPQPRTKVLESYASIVIAESQDPGETPFPSGEKTVVVRDRRALVDPRRFVKAKAQPSKRREQLLFVSASVLAAVLGMVLVAWLTGEPQADDEPVEALMKEASPSKAAEPTTARGERAPVASETPEVKLEELPIEKASPSAGGSAGSIR
jgi:hypothetical protein